MNDQRSTYDQLVALLELATEHGLYDAADWLKNRMFKVTEEVEWASAEYKE